MNFVILPNLIALAVLVAVFWAISGKAASQQLHLWLAGWVLVLIHFAAEFLSFGNGLSAQVSSIASVDALVLAGTAFLISVSGDDGASRQSRLALGIALPSLAYASAAAGGVLNQSFYFAVILGGVLFGCACCWRDISRSKSRILCVIAACGCVAFGAGWAVAKGSPAAGTTGILAALNFAIAALYAISYRRRSAGVVTTVIGFALWGTVFPLALVLKAWAPGIRLATGAWNIPEYLVAVGMILTLFEDQIETSKYHAYHDELTGLPNRRLLEDRLGLSLAHARRAKTKLAVLQLDLNRFKEVNDTYGHRAGDVALREVALRLATCVRPGDTLARSGGDEFTVITHLESRGSAEALVHALETTLSAPILIDGQEIQTGLSIGIAVYPDDGADHDQLHAAADRAMYAVKRAGRTTSGDDSENADVSLGGDESVTMIPSQR
jgi:diguanylate cyclase (GGDEF)-like protein